MIKLMHEGGFSMWIVLFVGVVAVLAAIRVVLRPENAKLAFLRALSIAECFAIFGGVATNLAAVMHHIPNHPEWSRAEQWPLVLMTGFGESLGPAILGSLLLSLAWLLTAIGVRKDRWSGADTASPP